MKVGIVSDTHDDLDAVAVAVELFEREAVDAVIHCGDFVAPFSVSPFEGDWAFHAVRGNNDGEPAVQSTVEAFGEYHGEVADLAFDGRSVAVYHGTSATLVDALVGCGDYDYVLHGHTHAHGVEERGGTVRVNPGGLPIPVAGADDAFRVATLDTDREGPDAVTHYVLDR